jgi:hypothetical protein
VRRAAKRKTLFIIACDAIRWGLSGGLGETSLYERIHAESGDLVLWTG